MAIIACGAAAWSIRFFAALWLFRFDAGVALDRRLGLNSLHHFALLPLRDFLSTVPSRMTAEVPLYPEGSPR